VIETVELSLSILQVRVSPIEPVADPDIWLPLTVKLPLHGSLPLLPVPDIPLELIVPVAVTPSAVMLMPVPLITPVSVNMSIPSGSINTTVAVILVPVCVIVADAWYIPVGKSGPDGVTVPVQFPVKFTT
jgi:hypothetical protein